jgi:hypothetical protein
MMAPLFDSGGASFALRTARLNLASQTEYGGFSMSRNRPVLGLIAAAAIVTGTAFAGSTSGKARNQTEMNHAQHMHTNQADVPTMTGQEAFGTIQEIVRILEADPATDWSKVNIAALREHLIDMDEVTMRAVASEQPLANGVAITVTGEGRTLDAIKRMVPAHTHELAALGWQARTEDLLNGVKLVVAANDPREIVKLKALGFMGIMVQGAHHQMHHLMMAKGEFAH